MEMLKRAARREGWAPGAWWGAMAAVGGAAAVWLLWGRHPVAAKVLTGLWVGGLAAPLAAVASLRTKRPRQPPPKAGEGTWQEWRTLCDGVGRTVMWGLGSCPDPDIRKRLETARKDLGDTLGAHPLRGDLERVCVRVAKLAVAPMQTWFWQQWLSGSAAELRREAERLSAEADGTERRLEIWEGAMEDGAAKAMRCLYPGMPAQEQEEGAKACVLAAWQGAKPGDPLVELAMALGLEWGALTRPWQPARARAHAMRIVRTGKAAADWYEGAEEGAEVLSGVWSELETPGKREVSAVGAGAGVEDRDGDGAGAKPRGEKADAGAWVAGDGTVGASRTEKTGAEPQSEEREGAAAGAGEARHRVRIRTRRRRRRRNQSVWTWAKEWVGHEIWRGWNILATFAQRLRYGMCAWRYRR